MTDLRLIELMPFLEDMPTRVHDRLGEVLKMQGEDVFAAGESIVGKEEALASSLAAECITLARSRRKSPVLTEPLRRLVPLAEHVTSGKDDVRRELANMTLREIASLADGQDFLSRVFSDVLAYASTPSSLLRALTVDQRVNTAAAAAAIASLLRSPVHPLESAVVDLAAWSCWEAGAETFGDISSSVARDGCPPEIERAWESLRSTPLAELGATRRHAFDPVPALAGIAAGLDARLRSILIRRTWALTKAPSLEELARELDITRERVRQLERHSSRLVEAELARPRNSAILRAAARLRVTLGEAASAEVVADTPAAHGLSPSASSEERLAALLLLHLAGPYELWDGWLVCRPAKDVVRLSVAELESLFENGYPLVSEAVGVLGQVPVRPEVAHEWLAALPGVRVLDEYVVPWRGTLADKAETVLRASGRPLTLEEIVDAINEKFSVRTLRNYLLSDRRFRRLGLRVFGLDEWGGEEYTKISDEIAQEIERRGGEAPLNELVSTLTSQFGVSANSVLAYAKGPQFERTSDGLIRIRTGRAELPRQRIDFTRRCFRVGEQWALRLTVTHDTIRGSGTAIPQGFAGYVGLAPGGEAGLQGGDVQLRFTWPSLLPSVGSLRPAVEALGAAEGDFLFLIADPTDGTAAFAHVAKEMLDGCVTSEDRLLLEVGVAKPAKADGLALVAHALGLAPGEATWASVRRRLRSRGEEDLLALVPTGDSGSESELDDLMKLVNL